MKKLAVKQIKEGDYENSLLFEPENLPIKSIDEFPTGIYTIKDVGGFFQTQILYTPFSLKEKYVDILDGTVGTAMKKLENFFSDDIKQKYEELGISHKTGLVIYGPPGTGKTVTSYIIMNKIVKKYNAICLVVGSNIAITPLTKALEEIKALKRPIVLFCDECESSLKGQEDFWLTLLDGHNSIPNFIFLGCTNYIKRIPKRMKRPSRIEHLIEVTSIEESVANNYVNEKVPKLDKNIRAAMVHYALECHSTIDSFKNAVKEYYIYGNIKKPDDFKEILKSYIREEVEEEN